MVPSTSCRPQFFLVGVLPCVLLLLFGGGGVDALGTAGLGDHQWIRALREDPRCRRVDVQYEGARWNVGKEMVSTTSSDGSRLVWRIALGGGLL